MRLSRFINEHLDEILAEWDAFAQTLSPAAEDMTKLALRDHAKQILQAVALDIESWQNAELQQQKSQGGAPDTPGKQSAASIHGGMRQASDFSLLQLSAEFRALRASVLRLWLPTMAQMSAGTIQEMIRFNEAIDQALAESIVTFSSRADHARELFLAILGHDLRAPLSTMTMAGELLANPSLAPDQAGQLAGRIRRSADLMNSMVDDLLGYSQTQLGTGMPVTRGDADVAAICRSAAEDASATHPACRFHIDSAGDTGGSYDAVRLHQLFANLAVNAAQYGAKDRPVSIDIRGEPDAVTVKVANYGPVIPEESLKSIFQPLVQLPGDDEANLRPRTSLGLGLFVAREIAVAHGGSITVESSEAEGTTFTVRLPRKATAA